MLNIFNILNILNKYLFIEYIYKMKSVYDKNNINNKNDFYFRLCITETANYIECLNLQNETQNKNYNCEELRKKYLSCVNYNNSLNENKIK